MGWPARNGCLAHRRGSARIVIVLLALAVLVGWSGTARSDQVSDGFALVPALTGQAVFSCQALNLNGNCFTDSEGSSAAPSKANAGHVRSNGDITLNGGSEVHGDATAGPGKQVRVVGNSKVTGNVSAAAAPFNCRPIDLSTLLTALQAHNDNGGIPRTKSGKNPLGGGDGRAFTLNGNDALTLPTGVYLFSSFTINGNSSLAVSGDVFILCTGAVTVNANHDVNSAGLPGSLRLWCSGTVVAVNGLGTLRGYIYAPNAQVALNGTCRISGAVFGKTVTLNGGAKVYRWMEEPASFSVEITSPTDGATVSTCEIPVTGQIHGDLTGVTLTINGNAVPVNTDGSFQAQVSLWTTPPGDILAQAHNQAGGTATREVHVVVPPPVVTLVSPPPGSVVAMRVLTLGGSAGTAATVTVNGIATVVASGAWSLRGFDLGADGVKPLQIVATNCGGSSTVTASLDLDTTPPVIAIDTPTQGAIITGSATTVAGPVFDAHLAGVTVQGVTASLAGGRFSAPNVPLSTGANTLVATATDRVGLTAQASVTVFTKLLPSVITLDAPSLALGGCLAAGQLRTVSGTLTNPNAAGTPPPTIQLQVAPAGGAAGSYPGVIAADGRSWSAAKVDLGSADGTAFATVTAADGSGNAAQATKSWPIDARTPAVQLTLDGAPFPGTTAGTTPPAGGQPALFGRAIRPRASVNDPGGATAPVAVMTLDGAPYTGGTPIAAEGDHVLVARATDCAGHEGDANARFRIDLTPPSLTSTNPADGAVLTSGPTTFSGVSDPDLATATVNGRPATLSTGSFVLTPYPWIEGQNEVAIVLVDQAGNQASYTRRFQVHSIPLTLQILESGIPVADLATFARVVTPELVTNDPKANIVATLNDAPFVSKTTISTSGSYTLQATATDAVSRRTSAGVHFQVDLSGGPTITITSPATGTVVATPTLAVNGTVSGSNPTVSVNGAAATVTAAAWTVPAIPLQPDLPTEILAIATDAAGRHASASVTVTLRGSGPQVIIVEPANGLTTNRTKIDVVGGVLGGKSATADGTVKVSGVVASLDTNGSFRALDVPLVEGSNIIVAEATDTQGRTGRASVAVNADLTPPNIVLLADGQPLAESATFSHAITLHVETTDNFPPVLPPAVRLNGQLKPTTTPAIDMRVADNGGYVVSIVAQDRAGNEARIERSFTLDVQGCSLAAIEPASGSTVAAATVEIRGRSGAAKTITVRVPVPGSDPVQYSEFPVRLADGTFLASGVALPVVGDNRLQITCVDPADVSHTQDILLKRLGDAGPVVVIQAPTNGVWTAADSLPVTGTVSDATATVTANGLAATVTATTSGAGSFAVAALPLVEGPNIIAARATDSVGRSGADRVTVWRDSLAPKLQITSPEANARLGRAGAAPASVDVSGLVDIDTEPNLSTVVVASAKGFVTATVDGGTGGFLATAVPLDDAAGANVAQVITATATDTLGHVGTGQASVFFDPTGPAITLGTPPDLARYSETSPPQIDISGEAWAADGALVAVNGSTLDPASLAWDAAGADGRRHTTFHAAMSLPSADGDFGVVARVSEPAGRVAQVRHLLFKDSTAPTVLQTAPADGDTGVDPNAMLLVLFSEPVLHASLAGVDGVTLARVSTGETLTGALAIAGSAVAFVPEHALVVGESYRLKVGTGVTDLVGHHLQAAVIATFTVAFSGADAPPVVDPLPPVVCPAGNSINITGTTAPVATVQVRDADLVFTGIADQAGHFEVTLPLSANGYHLLHVCVLSRSGVPGREVVIVLHVDCSAPAVSDASFDRGTGVVTVTFSESIDSASLTVGGASAAFRLAIADDPASTPQSGALTLSADGTVASIALATAADAWWQGKAVRLTVGPPAADLRGNAMAAAFETVFFPSGEGGLSGAFLSGEAYDDASGRPMAGATVRLFASDAALPGTGLTGGSAAATATTDGRGRYTMAGGVASGRYVLLVENNGYTNAVRRLALEPSTGAVPFDVRLTPRSDVAGNLDPAQGGSVALASTPDLNLTALAGAIPGTTSAAVRLTPLSEQGLPDFLPLGWTPAAAAEVYLENAAAALPEGAASPFAAGAVKLTLSLSSWVSSADSVTTVRYELATGVWITLPPAERFASAAGEPLARVTLDGPGTVALVVADANPQTQPPLPAGAGSVLLGVSPPASVSPMSATLQLNPAVVPPTGRSTARVVAQSADGVTAWPSGIAVQAYLEERLDLADGSELLEAPFSTDLVLYHPRLSGGEQGTSAVGSAGAMEFHVSPSPRAAQVLLNVGWENITVYPFPEQIERGQVLGPAGGSVASPDGVELFLPEGALSEKTVVQARLLTPSELTALTTVAGYTTLAAVRVDLAGHALARAATLKLNSPQGTPPAVPGDPRVVLAELVTAPADQRGSFPRLAARTSRIAAAGDGPERIVAAPEASDSTLPLEGIVREGTYLVLAAQSPIGFATGFVRTAGGTGLASARVSAENLGTADVSADGGRYSDVVQAGANRIVTALHPTVDQQGSAAIASLAPGEVAQLDIVVRATPPTILSLSPVPSTPAIPTVAPVWTAVSVLFSKPLDATTVTASTLTLELAGATGQPTGVFFNGTVSLTADGATIVWTPSHGLPPGRTYIASFVGGVRDAGGTAYAGPVPVIWQFSTSDSVAPSGQVHPEKFRITMPAGGTAQIIGDPGAVPAAALPDHPWTISPVIEGLVADPQRESFPANPGDGSFTHAIGNPPAFPVTIASKVWVTVIDPYGNVAASFRLGPFTIPDGKGFVAPAGEATTFTSTDGFTIDVPDDAFTAATVVTVTTLDPSGIGVATPPGVGLGAYVKVDFAGEANDTLRLRVPAPADALPGAKVFIAAPMAFPWGEKLRLLDVGGVLEEGGKRYLSNDPSLQPEPGLSSQGAAVGAELVSARQTGAGKLLPYTARTFGSGSNTSCADGKKQGLSRCFLQNVFMELTYATTAAWYYSIGTPFALLSGGASDPSAAYTGIYNTFADACVFVPPTHNWNGHYVLPVLLGSPVQIVERDIATGWITSQHGYDPISFDPGGLIDQGKLPGAPPSRPLLTDTRPFDLIRFRTPSTTAPQQLRLETQASADVNGKVTVSSTGGFALQDGAVASVYDLAPALPKDGTTPPAAPTKQAEVRICGNSASWATQPFVGSDELLLVVTPGDVDAETLDAFEFSFDEALDGTIAQLPAGQVATLRDLGPTEPCGSASNPVTIPVSIELDQNGHLLRIKPAGTLTAGHRFSLTLQAGKIYVKGADGNPLTYWPTAPTQFDFATRAITGQPIGGSAPGTPSLGDTNDARDLMQFGNLMLVGSTAGRILAVDVTDPAADHGFKLYAIANTYSAAQVRSFATDGHNRLFFTELVGSMMWAVKTLRVEDARAATTTACQAQPGWAASLPCFDVALGGARIAYMLGEELDITDEEWLAMDTLPTGIPEELQVLVEDETGKTLDLPGFFAAYTKGSLDSLSPDAKGIYTFDLPLVSTLVRSQSGLPEPSTGNPTPPGIAWRTEPCDEPTYDRYQRVTVDNVTTGQSWSLDIENTWTGGSGGGTATLHGLRARAGDQLRVRYNLRALGYVALMGSGITVVDLNRYYGLATPPGPASDLSQCARRLGKYEGQDITWPDCENGLIYGIDMTSSVAVHSGTGCAGGACARGSTSIDIYSPRVSTGVIHTSSPVAQPGNILEVGLEDYNFPNASCTRNPLPISLRAVALANDATWWSRGISGTVEGVFALPKQAITLAAKQGDLLFVSLGRAGVFVYDVSNRTMVLIGRLAVDGHSIYRLQVDSKNGLLFAGGFDDAFASIIDVWKIASVNGAPDPDGKLGYTPRPLVTLHAPWSTDHLALDAVGDGLLFTWGGANGPQAIPFGAPEFILSGMYRPEAKDDTAPEGTRPRPFVEKATSGFVPLGVPMELSQAAEQTNRAANERNGTAAFKLRVALPGSLGDQLTAKVQSLRALPP
ncbi:MAG: Ig-like domain-containing protein, partial [Thermoanaerobaculales bacterium]